MSNLATYQAEAKTGLDKIIRKSRVHFYKPIQVAEILYHHRTNGEFDLADLEAYRNLSKKWRDEVSYRLIGRVCTSSQRFQDNLFEPNAVPPSLLKTLGAVNEVNSGLIEAYVYRSLEARLDQVRRAAGYIKNSTVDSFSLTELLGMFQQTPGLKRSIDKIYEIAVHALFVTIVRELKAQVTLEVMNEDQEILHDFQAFLEMVLGIDPNNTKIVLPAALYRVGVANAADSGLDMWANFGTVFQVKHITLKPEIVEEIADNLVADRIVIVCLNSEKSAIETLLSQVGWGSRIQGIITLNDLDEWYRLCFSERHRSKLGTTLLADILREFNDEFPSSEGLYPFLQERDYDQIKLPTDWGVVDRNIE